MAENRKPPAANRRLSEASISRRDDREFPTVYRVPGQSEPKITAIRTAEAAWNVTLRALANARATGSIDDMREAVAAFDRFERLLLAGVAA